MNNPTNPGFAQKFYQNLGKLFYAVAASDKVVKKEEIETLKNIVEQEWVSIDDYQDEFGTDTAYQIEIIFDWLEANQPDAFLAFKEFSDFKKEHENLFNSKINKLILKTADAIAASFVGINKSELIMLSKLKSIL
jgi:hypothetical protein